jgi:ABC-type transport system involved in multi-copper enzyme maturation permease subunit
VNTAKGAGLPGLIRAECRKIWVSHVPLAFLVSTVVVVSLFALDLYHFEGMRGGAYAKRAAMDVLPILAFASWKTLLLPAALIAFCAFWTTLDSQYGMIRVGCVLPLSRTQYLLGRWLALSAYVLLFGAVFVLVQLAWVAAYSGLAGVGAAELARVVRFSVEVLAFLLALAGVASAVASTRRTVGAGVVTAYLAAIGLAFMTMLPHDLVPPRLLLMRHFFFPLQEFVDPFAAQGYRDTPFARVYTRADFWLVVLATPFAFLVPALLYFRRRDITE